MTKLIQARTTTARESIPRATPAPASRAPILSKDLKLQEPMEPEELKAYIKARTPRAIDRSGEPGPKRITTRDLVSAEDRERQAKAAAILAERKASGGKKKH